MDYCSGEREGGGGLGVDHCQGRPVAAGPQLEISLSVVALRAAVGETPRHLLRDGIFIGARYVKAQGWVVLWRTFVPLFQRPMFAEGWGACQGVDCGVELFLKASRKRQATMALKRG